MYTNCEYFNWNLKDSAADSKLKLLKDGEVFGEEKPGGEKRIHIGSSAKKAKFDSFFFPKGEDKVLFEFSKSDLLLYMIDAKDEYMHPKQKYRLDISQFYDDLLKETLSIEDETLYVRFETNIDKRYYLARPKGDEFYTNYSFISKICLPYVTEIVFVRAVDEDGVYHFFLKPKFVKVGPSAEGIQAAVANEYKENTGSTAQTIFYGCPGTGKSFKVKGLTEGHDGTKAIYFDKETGKRIATPDTEEDRMNQPSNVFRTTFHPDYDYSTFVGAYKPQMKTVEVKVKVDDNENSDTVKEEVLRYTFVPQVFTNAYVRAWKSFMDDDLVGEEKNVFLIIEEINRGNCAQIFGDLIQILDRSNGNSDYAIIPDEDLRKHLEEQGVPSSRLRLPANLHIYATMNTSDQSLFPMDSAFKRRWEMEYIPINLKHDLASTYTIEFDDHKFMWTDFLKAVNTLIRKATDSEDKQMGEFFVKNKVINLAEFKNKVLFYIWNDVCKDLYGASRVSPLYFMRDTEKTIFTFAELFSGRTNEDDTITEPIDLILGFMQYLKVEDKGTATKKDE